MSSPTSPRTCLLVASIVGAVGCATRGNVELLEARLRDQEDRNAELVATLEQTREEVRIARRDSDVLRGHLAERGEEVLLPEQADALFRARELQINQLLTAGVDGDGVPGDEAITTVVTPVDGSGRPIRLPGELVVVMTSAEGNTPLQRWTISPEESRSLWQRDLLAGGFRLQLPLEGRPPENVRIAARLNTADGRSLEANHAFALRLGEPPTPPTPPVPAPQPLDLATETFEAAEFDAETFDGEAFDAQAFEPDTTGIRRTAARSTDEAARPTLHFPEKRDRSAPAPPTRFAPPDGTDDPNGNGLDRTRPVRTSDSFRFENGTIPRYN